MSRSVQLKASRVAEMVPVGAVVPEALQPASPSAAASTRPSAAIRVEKR